MNNSTFYSKYVKRQFDVLISLLLLILLVPLFLFISLAIFGDSGRPVFFKQDRIGKDGKTFKIIKFRTMVIDAEKKGDGLSLKSGNDPRITKVGSLLRKTSLDELPQLINILAGDMSFIGPRPPVVYHPYNGYENYPLKFKERFSVRPGLSGYAQIKLRNTGTWQERFEYDLSYVYNITLKNDFLLILKTIFKVIRKEGIYES